MSFLTGSSSIWDERYLPGRFLGVLASREINHIAVDLVGLQQTGWACE
jgi:hypothetical protein